MRDPLKPHDESSLIEDHQYEPRAEWWSLCRHCNLAQAAHASSSIDTRAAMFEEQMQRYGEIRHADPIRGLELTREFREKERERIHQGGRARIAYIGDEVSAFDD